MKLYKLHTPSYDELIKLWSDGDRGLAMSNEDMDKVHVDTPGLTLKPNKIIGEGNDASMELSEEDSDGCLGSWTVDAEGLGRVILSGVPGHNEEEEELGSISAEDMNKEVTEAQVDRAMELIRNMK